ncbi:ATP-binding protein [Frigidibacter sp. MR17.24]|uniref:ATP-binding protein n=1 Tax=Frigidibacter sp. MR17.24 TaxID=3127345 RepID=UPI003012A042
MMAWWRQSLARQMLGVMLIALLLGQAAGFILSRGSRIAVLEQAMRDEFVSRTASLLRVVQDMPDAQRRDILLASATSHTRYWTSETDPTEEGRDWYARARAYLLAPLDDITRFRLTPGMLDLTEAERKIIDTKDFAGWRPLPQPLWEGGPEALILPSPQGVGTGLIAQMPDGRWLNGVIYKRRLADPGLVPSLISTAITALVLSLVGAVSARRLARPLRSLALTADAIGRGEEAPRQLPRGPEDIRALHRAFTRMQDRLQVFVDDRTRMLAAIGHDLRTPLTTLRLRAEMIADDTLRDRMTETLEEMQRMSEATLSFARGVTVSEPTRTVELGALVCSLCDDLSDLGQSVSCAEIPALPLRCRPDALRRALRNLLENAVRYGGSAEVDVRKTQDMVDVIIRDRGPGIPDHLLEKVFLPFYRIDAARGAAQGSVGLGLSIARAVAHEHGGGLTLENAAPGLRAILHLPRGI